MRNRDLPEDVVMEILSRLPVKCLLRFMCVCKSWYALIKNADFISKHLTWATSHNLHRGAILNRGEWMGYPRVSTFSNENLELSGDVDLSQLFQDEVHGVQVFGPCNGTLCFAATLSKDRELHGDYDRIVLWNPAIRESKMLPPIHRPPNISFCNYNFGFGFDPKTNDYKVVRILNSDSPCEVVVYSLSADSWRVIDSSPNPSYWISSPRFPSYLNGVYHWRARWWPRGKDNMHHPFLLSFDMSNEVFQEVLPFPTEGSSFGNIAVINNSVALILRCGGAPECWYVIWVLNESGVERTWTKILTTGHLPPHLIVIQLREDGLVVLSDEDACLVLYDPRTQELRDLGIYDNGCSQLISYTESLVFLNGSGNVLEQQDNS